MTKDKPAAKGESVRPRGDATLGQAMEDGTFSFSIPRLRTARLLLREPRLEDFEPYVQNATDPEALRYIGGPFEPRDAWRRFQASAGGWVTTGKGWWWLELADGSSIGHVGVFRRETGPELEIGWSIHKPYWRKGYASEAAQAALDYARARFRERVIAYVSLVNTPSIAVAEKIGMRRDAQVDFWDSPHWRYAIDAPGL